MYISMTRITCVVDEPLCITVVPSFVLPIDSSVMICGGGLSCD